MDFTYADILYTNVLKACTQSHGIASIGIVSIALELFILFNRIGEKWMNGGILV